MFERVLVRAFDKAVRRKPLAFAADAGLMQIEWSEGCRSSRESSRPVEDEAAHLCKDESVAELSLGGVEEEDWV